MLTDAKAERAAHCELERELISDGFAFDKKRSGCVRPIAGGCQMLNVEVYDYSPRFLLCLITSVRLDQVEAIFHQFYGTDAEFQESSPTLLVNRSKLYGDEYKDVDVYSEGDIKQAVDSWRPVLRTRILPFLNRTQDVCSVDSAYNRGQLAMGILDEWYSMHGVILAKLASNPDFEDIAASLRREHVTSAERAAAKSARAAQSIKKRLQQFDTLVEYLRSLPQ